MQASPRRRRKGFQGDIGTGERRGRHCGRTDFRGEPPRAPSRTGRTRATTEVPHNDSSAHPFKPTHEDRHDQQTDPTDDGKLEKFPDFPPRDDMQNSLHLDQPAYRTALHRHFGSGGTTIILSEIPVRWPPGQQEGHRIPDLLIAFGVDFNVAVEQMGYSIRHQGKLPDFVLEIASPSTGRQDYTGKRNDYAAFGIPEYCRSAPSGGQLSMALRYWATGAEESCTTGPMRKNRIGSRAGSGREQGSAGPD